MYAFLKSNVLSAFSSLPTYAKRLLNLCLPMTGIFSLSKYFFLEETVNKMGAHWFDPHFLHMSKEDCIALAFC